MTKALIDQLTIAHAWHEVTSVGGSTEGMSRPKSLGYGIGLAVVLGAMMFSSNLLLAYAQ